MGLVYTVFDVRGKLCKPTQGRNYPVARNPNTTALVRTFSTSNRFGKVVGDPGIEPGMGLPGGVTVRCRTLQLVTRSRRRLVCGGVNIARARGRQQENQKKMQCTCFLVIFDAWRGG